MLTIGILGFVAAAVFATAMFFPRSAFRTYPLDLTPRAMHHEYLGAVILVVSAVMGAEFFAALGAALMWDDAVQHAVQWATGRTWHTPLVRAYADAYARYGWLRALNRWLDELFGAKAAT